MTTRSYSRADWQRAQVEWADFSDEWEPVRLLAGDRGILFPPAGGKWDQWDDEHPSQRAILIRAIRETPELLRAAIARSRSWQEVIANLTSDRDAMRAEFERREAERLELDAADPNRIGRDEAVLSLKEIYRRIGATE